MITYSYATDARVQMLGNISSSTCSLVFDIVFISTLSYIEYDDNVVCFVRLFILAINALIQNHDSWSYSYTLYMIVQIGSNL